MSAMIGDDKVMLRLRVLRSAAKRSKELMFQGALPLFDPWQYPQIAFLHHSPALSNTQWCDGYYQDMFQLHKNEACSSLA